MMRCEDFVDLLAATSGGVQAAHQEVLGEWLLEEPPVTTLFAALGDRIAEDFDSTSADSSHEMFLLIEKAMDSGDPGLVTAVATGLIEALVNRAVRSESLWTRIAPLLGPRSLNHAEAWLST
jgi:hypothetical protein